MRDGERPDEEWGNGGKHSWALGVCVVCWEIRREPQGGGPGRTGKEPKEEQGEGNCNGPGGARVEGREVQGRTMARDGSHWVIVPAVPVSSRLFLATAKAKEKPRGPILSWFSRLELWWGVMTNRGWPPSEMPQKYSACGRPLVKTAETQQVARET